MLSMRYPVGSKRHEQLEEGEATQDLDMSVTLVLSPGTELRGRVVEMTRSGATAVVEAGATRASHDTEVEFVFESFRFSSPLRGLARVVGWLQEGDTARCRLEFADPEDLEDRLPRDLRESLTRRRYERLKLAPAIQVEITGPDHAVGVTGDLLDLSPGGMKVILRCPLADARSVGEWRDVDLMFRLPGCDGTIEAAASIRTRFGLRLGLEFDGPRTSDFEEIQAKIRQFMAEQQRSTS